MGKLRITRWVKAVLVGTTALAFLVLVGYSVFSSVTCPAVAGDGIVYKVHDRGWLDDHQADAKMDSKSCEMCHEREYCNACHFSDNPLEAFHKTNYVYTHTLDRFIDRTECASCHDYESFCNACHTAAAGRPADHLVTGWTTTGHPEGAREDIERCASCHSGLAGEQICLRCHRVGINPHGDDFDLSFDKGPWKDDAGYVCYKCHVFGKGF